MGPLYPGAGHRLEQGAVVKPRLLLTQFEGDALPVVRALEHLGETVQGHGPHDVVFEAHREDGPQKL
jgi:hypothetical protein